MTIEQMIEVRNLTRKRCGWIKYHMLCFVARLSINARAKRMQATFDQSARHLASEQKSEELRDIYLACWVDRMRKSFARK